LGEVSALPTAPLPQLSSIEHAAALLRTGLRTALILGGAALHGNGLAAAGRIAAGTNTKLLAEYPFTRMERGAGRPGVDRIPYVFEQAVERLKEFNQIILVSAAAPRSYFATQGKSTVPTPSRCLIHKLVSSEQDSAAALERLAEALGLVNGRIQTQKLKAAGLLTGEITLPGLAAVVAGLLPENVIVVDESMTSGHAMMTASAGCSASRLVSQHGRFDWNRHAASRWCSRRMPFAACALSLGGWQWDVHSAGIVVHGARRA